MNNLLREWLIHQLGLEVNFPHPNNLCSKFQNGVLIGKLLQNYNIVSSTDFSQLRNEDDDTTKISNFEHLKIWLNTINISLDDDTVNGIISGKSSDIFGLLYRLCFFLECPNRLHLTGHVKQPLFLGTFDLPLKPENKFVDFTYKEERRNKRTVGTINVNKLPYFERLDEILSVVYDEINQFERSLPEKLNNWMARGYTSCTRFLSDLKAQKENSKIYNSWIKHTIDVHLETNLDVNTRHNRNVLRDKSMPDRLTWMSECEKNILHKVNNARFFVNNQNTVPIKNVQFVDEYNADEKDYKINEETRLQMEAELTERNERTKKDEQRQIVKSVVKDLADFSVGCGVHRKKLGGNRSKHSWENWMEMVVNGRPLLADTVHGSPGRLLDAEYVAGHRPYADEELKTQAVLDRRDVLQYLTGTGGWSGQSLGVKTYDHPIVSRVLGFLVYDVFTSLNMLPDPLVDVQHVTVGPVVGAFDCGQMEPSTKRDVCEALIERDILPVLPETAVEHCLNAFYRETDNAELIRLLETFDARTAAIPFDYSKSVNMQESRLNNVTVTLPDENGSSKQTQTPEKIDKYYESERVKCGEVVFVNIYRNQPLPKHNLIDCVLCYIKDKQMSGGCVLIEFPREEIMIFEERLALKHLPPYGSYDSMSEKNTTILVPFKGPDLGDGGRYNTIFTSYLKILSFENIFDDNWDDALKYYNSHGVLTLLQSTNDHLNLDSHKIELFCDVLTGQIVDWTDQSDWVLNIQLTDQKQNTVIDKPIESEESQPKPQEPVVYKRKRTHGKSEFDFMDHIYSRKSDSFTNKLSTYDFNLSKVKSIKSKMFDAQLSSNIGKILANFWKSIENIFVQNMEKCFHYRRILFSEQEFFLVSIDNYLNEILNRPSIKKIEIIKNLQYEMSIITYEVDATPYDSRRLLLAVLGARNFMKQLTNEKIEKCRQFLGNNNIERWVEKQMASMFLIYKCMLQTEVNRTMSTLFFINSYMSKLYNQNIPTSMMPKNIDVTLTKEQGSKVNLTNSTTIIEEYIKRLKAITNTIGNKVKSIFSTTSTWLENRKDSQNSNLSEKKTVYLKIWKSVVEMESWRSRDQLKLILTKYQSDVKEIDDSFVQYRVERVQQINNRLQNELFGIDRICDLFETAINERCIVRHEIIYFDDNFYLNPDNVLFPKNPPPQPLPLLEPEDIYAISIGDLETIVTQLMENFPEKRVSLVLFNSWLMNFTKYLPHVDWLRNAPRVLRNLFGSTVNFVDWSDFIIHCMELPYPGIDELLIFKKKFMEIERERDRIFDENHIEGTIDKADFDSVLLWYQSTLPPSPSICLRFMKTKDLLFTIFSIDGKLDYLLMLLAMCRDDRPIMGLVKTIYITMDYNIMADRFDVSNDVNEKNSTSMSKEKLYKCLFACLKNYMAPDNSDIERLLSTVLNIHNDKSIFNDDSFALDELIKHDGIKSLSEIGFRFNTMSLSNILNSL